jgi:hypothetical protein
MIHDPHQLHSGECDSVEGPGTDPRVEEDTDEYILVSSRPSQFEAGQNTIADGGFEFRLVIGLVEIA